ncbi:MAG: ABC transporter ATP-binding protein [Candidatus Limnocylindrales bacterium]
MGFGRGPGGGRFGEGDFEPVPRERRGQTVRRIAAFFRPYGPQVLLVVVSIVATSLLGVVNPFLLRAVLDVAIPEADLFLLNVLVLAMIIVPLVSGLIGVGQAYVNNRVGQAVMQDLRDAVYEHLQRMPLRFFTETRTGEIQSRIANDVGGVQSVVTDTASSVFSNLTIVLTTLIAMVLIDWRLTAISLTILPFFLYLTYRVGKVRRAASEETQKSIADMSAITEETLSVSGILLAKTFGQQSAAVERFRVANARLARLQLRQSLVGRWFFMLVGTVFSVMPAVVYWIAGMLIIGGDPAAPTIGDIVAFTTLQARLFFPLGLLLNVQVEVQGALALFDRIFEYLDMRPEIVDKPGAVRLRPSTMDGRVRFRNVFFAYPDAPDSEGAEAAGAEGSAASHQPGEGASRRNGNGRPFALRDIDFEVEPGQLVALVGHSGSGKTTSTYLLPRLYDVDSGAVEIDGRDVRDVTLASLGDVIGFVTQEAYLFHASVRENLAYAKPEATDRELRAAARLAAIHDRINELPEGYDTVVGERGYKLSGGEKQRIALARVLLKDPRVLVLDEATSALDTVSERLIQRAIETTMRGRTTVAIAHRLSTILRADLILVYEAGRIVERGTHAQLLAQNGVYAALYHEQFESTAPA